MRSKAWGVLLELTVKVMDAATPPATVAIWSMSATVVLTLVGDWTVSKPWLTDWNFCESKPNRPLKLRSKSSVTPVKSKSGRYLVVCQWPK